MEISTIIYSSILFTALLCAGYNWMYKKEIHRMEHQVGISIPLSVLQLVSAIIFISLSIATLSFLMLFISFLFGR